MELLNAGIWISDKQGNIASGYPLFEAIDEASGIAASMDEVLGVGSADIKAIREVLLAW